MPSRDSPAPRFPPLRIPIFYKEKVYFEGARERGTVAVTHMGSKVLLSQDFSASKFSMIILTTIQSGPGPPPPRQQQQQQQQPRRRGPRRPPAGTPAPAAPPRTLRRLPVQQKPPGRGRRPSDMEGAEPVEQRLLSAGPALAAPLSGSASRAQRGSPPAGGRRGRVRRWCGAGRAGRCGTGSPPPPP